MQQQGKYTLSDIDQPPQQQGQYTLADIDQPSQKHNTPQKTSPFSSDAGASLNQSALAGMTGMPSPSFTPDQRQEFEQGKVAGSLMTPGGGAINVGRGAVDIGKGNVSKGGHEIVSGVGAMALPFLPGAAVSSPLRVGLGLGASYMAGKGTKYGAAAFGANPEQQQFAEDLGNVAGGYAGGVKLPGMRPAPVEVPNVWEGEAPAEIPAGRGSVQVGDLGAKAKAVGKVAVQYGASKVPVAGALVRRPSLYDLLDAARAKAAPSAEVPVSGNVSNAEARGPYQPYRGDLRVNPSGDTDVAATQELPPAEADVKPAQPNTPPVEQLYGKYSGRSNLAKNQKQMQRYGMNAPENQPETPFTPQPFFNPSVLERIFGMKVKTAKAGD